MVNQCVMSHSGNHCLWFGDVVTMKTSTSGDILTVTVADKPLIDRIVLL